MLEQPGAPSLSGHPLLLGAPDQLGRVGLDDLPRDGDGVAVELQRGNDGCQRDLGAGERSPETEWLAVVKIGRANV